MKRNQYKDNPKFRVLFKKHLSTIEPAELAKELDIIIEKMSEDEFDGALVEDYLEVLRDKTSLDMSDYDAEKSFAAFKEKYALQYKAAISTPPPRRLSPLRFRTAGIIAAAVCLVFALLFIPKDAYGNNYFARIMHWGEEVLSFRGLPPGGRMTLPVSSESEYRSLAEALEQNGISTANCPTWIPAGFALAELSSFENEETKLFIATYKDDEYTIRIIVRYCINPLAAINIEKDPGGSIYTAKGQEYYIFENMGVSNVVWEYDNITYQVFGNISTDDIYLMIDSIKERR